MHISEVEVYRRDKEHLMRNEGTHPANRKDNNNPFSEENVKAYNVMKFTKDPTGILPDDSYEAGKASK